MRKRLLVVVLLVLLSALIIAPTPAIAKTRTRISISVSSALEHADYTPTVSGQLKTSSGKAIKSTRVYLYRDGAQLASAKTDSRGRYTFAAPIAVESADTATWFIRFKGSSKYRSSKSSTVRTTAHVNIDGSVPYQGIDAGGNFSYKWNLWLPAWRGFWMEFSHPVVVEIVNPNGGGVWAGSGGLPVTEFEFDSSSYEFYDLLLYTNTAWGGDDSVQMFLW